jgi:CrcB protein
MMMPLIVFLGAGIGGVARYALGGWIQQGTGASFPWGTLAINISGSLALGLLYPLLEGPAASPHWRAFLAIGVCGGFTTFSTFSYETIQLLQDGAWGRAFVYVAGSVLVSLLAVFLGIRFASGFLPRG